ncbi:MAG: sugar kinase [Bacteroidetes bacterium CG12_big_fil_rev_8_21_14_0_65_60_17]|nr:MAG: sugar kinase [Bacteroidetes bacterium CG12_big_fil_rev_8_21_14_0_65_60_17]
MGTTELAVGIDLGGTSIKAALVSRQDGLVKQKTAHTEADKGPVHVLDTISHLVRSFTGEAGDVLGVGIGSPGAINWERTTVSRPPNLPGWEVVNVGDELAKRLDTPLFTLVENDANAAGLGSAHYGAGRDFSSFIMVTLGTGVGGAIIYENRIFRGSTGAAGEIGHMSIDYEGPIARSGVSGAIEAYLGQRFLSRQARYMLLNRRDSLIHQVAQPDLKGITPRMLYDAAVSGDRGAREVLEWAGHKLGRVLGSIVNLLDIRKFVVGGGLSGAGDYILEPARRSLERSVLPALSEGLEIVQETGGNDVGMLGAAHMVFQHVDEHR